MMPADEYTCIYIRALRTVAHYLNDQYTREVLVPQLGRETAHRIHSVCETNIGDEVDIDRLWYEIYQFRDRIALKEV